MQPAGTPDTIPPEIKPAKPNSGIWGGWTTFALGIAIVAIFAIAQTAVALVFLFQKLASGSIPATFDEMMKLASNGDLVSYATIASGIFGVGAIILFIKIRKGSRIRDYLGLKAIPVKTYFILLGIIVLLVGLTIVVETAFNISQDAGFTTDTLMSTTCPALLWIAVVVFAPLFEEFLFRGFLLVGFQQTRMGAVGAVTITAVGWTVLHFQYDWFGMLSILVLGIVLGIVRIKTKSLWSTIFIHSLWNLIAIVMATLYINGIVK